METAIAAQGAALLLALGLGAGTGLMYDLLRPLRHRASKTLASLLDGLFSICVGVGLFSFAMSAGNGKLGTWELALALLGFLLYMYALSDVMLPVFESVFQITGKWVRTVKKIIKKFQVSTKKLFQKVKECFIIKR